MKCAKCCKRIRQPRGLTRKTEICQACRTNRADYDHKKAWNRESVNLLNTVEAISK